MKALLNKLSKAQKSALAGVTLTVITALIQKYVFDVTVNLDSLVLYVITVVGATFGIHSGLDSTPPSE